MVTGRFWQAEYFPFLLLREQGKCATFTNSQAVQTWTSLRIFARWDSPKPKFFDRSRRLRLRVLSNAYS